MKPRTKGNAEHGARLSDRASGQEELSKQMPEIDAAFRAASGISDRRYYKIFYSHIHPFPLLVLGHNPGGETDGTDLSASSTYFENWEHDYLCFRNDSRYAIARPTCDLLAAALRTNSIDTIRQVPATNVIFRRSRKIKTLDLSPRKAAQESAPFLRRILEIVNPHAVLLIANTAYELFKAFHCKLQSIREDSALGVYTPNGKSDACIFISGQAWVYGLDREVQLFMVGHPSKYSRRHEWTQVVERLGRGLAKCNVAPIEDTFLVPLKPIMTYGMSI